MATFDSGRQRYSMNFYASHQRPLQRRSYTGRPSRPGEGQLRGHMQLSRQPPMNVAGRSAYPPKPDAVAGTARISGLCQGTKSLPR